MCLLLFFYDIQHNVLFHPRQPLLLVWTLSDDTRLVRIMPDGHTVLIHYGYCFLYEDDDPSKTTTSAIRLDNSKRYHMIRPTRLLDRDQILKPTVLKYDTAKSLTVVDILNQYGY